MLSQVRLSVGGWVARAFQKLLTQSTRRVRMMSSYTARTSGGASAYSTSFTVAMGGRDPSAASEGGRALVHEGANALPRVLRLEADVLGECLELERLAQVALEVVVDGPLGE